MLLRISWTALLLLQCVTVIMGQEPHLEVQPDSISKSLGDTVYVSCTAKVDDPKLVTEMRWIGPNDRAIPSIDGSIDLLEEGPGDLGFLIRKLKEQDTGVYNCTAVYAGNQNLHASINVTSYESISFGDTPTHQTPIVGTDALIKCIVTSKPSSAIDWLKDGMALKTDERHIIQQDGVLVRAIEEADEGVYRCRARVKGRGTFDSRDIQVEVHVPPKIITPPENTAGVEKESVTFQCVAEGKPAPQYSWVDDQSRPLEGEEGYYIDDVNGKLTILHLRPDQAGTYRCTASNPAGDDVAEAQLQVLTKPKLEQFLNITVDANGTAEFRCVYSGDPRPEIIFQKESNHEPFVTGLNSDDRIEVRQSIDENGFAVGILKIREVTRTDDGLYTCTGSSGGGITVGWGHITVQFIPTFELQATNEFWSWEQEAVNLTCLATSIPNATIQWYLRNREIPKEDHNLMVMALGPIGVLQVTPLDNSYFGTYTCEATNILGMVVNDLFLKQVHTPGPVTQVKVDKITATTITFRLLEPGDNGGRPITMFVVQYIPKYEADWSQALVHTWTKGSAYTLDNLIPLEHYTFRFAARNEVGTSEWSGEKTEKMPDVTAPEEPLIFSNGDEVISVVYPDHYNMQWKTPLDNGSPITKFTIIYYQVRRRDSSWDVLGAKTERTAEHPGTNSYNLQNLRPDSHYRIELRAYNDIGFSSPAELVIKTASDPSAPSSDSSVEEHTIHYSSISTTAGPPSGAPYTEPTLPVGVLIAIVVIAVLVLAIVIDIFCFFCRDAGVTATLVRKVAGNEKDSEAMIETGKTNSEKSDKNGSPISEDNKAAAADGDLDAEKEQETTETTPMIIKGDGGGDKAAILKEEEEEEAAAKAAVEQGREVTKDSPV